MDRHGFGSATFDEPAPVRGSKIILFIGGPEDGKVIVGPDADSLARWPVGEPTPEGTINVAPVPVGWKMWYSSTRFTDAYRAVGAEIAPGGVVRSEALGQIMEAYARFAGGRDLNTRSKYEVIAIEGDLIVFRFVDEPATEPETAA